MSFNRIYSDFILKFPKIVLTLVLAAVSFMGIYSLKVEIDASSETLLLQDDKDLAFTRLVNKNYHNPDFLVITYTPKNDLFSPDTLDNIRRIGKELEALSDIESVTSIINVPLLQNPSKSIKELIQEIPTLESADVNMTIAKDELLTSPIYKENLVSRDFKTTALMLNMYEDKRYLELLNKRNSLAERKRENKISAKEIVEFNSVSAEFKTHRDNLREKTHKNIIQIRAIMEKYRGDGELFLGGINMIADDMISFVKYDLRTYGTAVLVLLIVIMWFVFRQVRFVLLPVFILTLSVAATTGLLGVFGWEVTVVSSNFISLQLIVTMSLIIHLSVRYRELLLLRTDSSHKDIIEEAVISMIKPCFFVIITTIAGFSSLAASNILPVMNLGWMMSAGIAISFIITFLVFPAVMILLKKKQPDTFFESHFVLTKKLGSAVVHYGKTIMVISLLSIVFSFSGAYQLIVENSFIDYFKKSTEIYQGMEVIDRQLGGTTPLDIIIDFPKNEVVKNVAVDVYINEDEFDEFEEEFLQIEHEEQYWFTSEKMGEIEKIHDYLESIPEVGKVLSFATMLKVGRKINQGENLDNLELALLYNELPEKFKKILTKPFLKPDQNQVRFTLRIIDSDKDLRRNELLKRIKRELNEKVGIPKENIRMANMMVMYNNMLQSLFNSQIMTIGLVVLILAVMFLILFKSIKVAIIAMIANIIPIGMVFGFMGWIGIPLDMMTITIAAISMGIAVDDTIHYLHRFKRELAKDGDYIGALHRSHASIGYAMYYTTVAIMIGFSVLVLSNFLPTIYFGLLTLMAMLMALIADLLLLPKLILWIRAYD